MLHSPELGRYMVASRDLKAGDVILREDPIVVGPKQVTEPVCLGCYKRVDGSYRYRGLEACRGTGSRMRRSERDREKVGGRIWGKGIKR